MISGNITNIEGLTSVQQHLEGLQASRQTYMVQFAIACRQSIEQALVGLLADRARHFNIQIEQDGQRMSIKVVAASDVGKYLYYGTPSHEIVAQSGQAMPLGGNRFMKANHPGTKGMKKKIDAAVQQAVADAKASMGQLGARG